MKQNVKIIKQTIITEFEDGSVVRQEATGNGVSSTITQTNERIKINVKNETFDIELYERVKSPIIGYHNKPTNWKVAPNINQKS